MKGSSVCKRFVMFANGRSHEVKRQRASRPSRGVSVGVGTYLSLMHLPGLRNRRTEPGCVLTHQSDPAESVAISACGRLITERDP